MATDEHFDEENELTNEGSSELEPDNLVDLEDVYRGRDDYEEEEDSESSEGGETSGEGEAPAEAEEQVPPEEEAESLDVMLAREKVLDETQVAAPADESREGFVDPEGPAGDEEFVCRSCFLVKRRAQLSDERKLICRDCAA